MNIEVTSPSDVRAHAQTPRPNHLSRDTDPDLSPRENRRPVSRVSFLRLASALTALAITGALLWIGGVAHYFIPRNWGEVEPGFYRSGQISRFLMERTLRERRIGLVVFMSGDKANRPDVQAEQSACRKLGVERMNCPLAGNGTGDINSYIDALEAVCRARNEGRAVLVHCHTGSQRTGGVVAYYRLLVQRRPPAEVYAELRRYGHDPHDNPELIRYLNEHMGEVSTALADRGIIDRASTPPPLIDVGRD